MEVANHWNRIKDLLKNDEHWDVHLAGFGGFICGHKFILASYSPLLKQFFLDEKVDNHYIIIPHFPVDSIQRLVKLIYGGKVYCTSKDDVIQLKELMQLLDIRLSGLFQDGINDGDADVVLKGTFDNGQVDFANWKVETEYSFVDSDSYSDTDILEAIINKPESPATSEDEMATVSEPVKKKRKVGRPKKSESYKAIHKPYSNKLKKNLECESCGKLYSRSNTLTQHKILAHGAKKADKTFQCFVCLCSFDNRNNLSAHLKLHSGSKSFRCDICDKSFNRMGNLRQHKYTHEEDKPFQCNKCGKCFSREFQLGIHMRQHEEKKPYECMLCGKGFIWESVYKSHMVVHRGDKPFLCSICGKSFSRKRCLLEHVSSHAGRTPFKCEVCGKTFSYRSSYHVHMKIHKGEKKYHCEVCQKGFSRGDHLRQHMETHDVEKRYRCVVCNKGFSRKTAVTEHMSVHTGKKPYTCNVCNSGFYRPCVMKQHMVTHHAGLQV